VNPEELQKLELQADFAIAKEIKFVAVDPEVLLTLIEFYELHTVEPRRRRENWMEGE
jgi:hypothetical protein